MQFLSSNKITASFHYFEASLFQTNWRSSRGKGTSISARAVSRVSFFSNVQAVSMRNEKNRRSGRNQSSWFLSCESWRNPQTRRPVAWTLLTRMAREYPTWCAFGANLRVKLLFTVRRLGVSMENPALENEPANKRSVHLGEERTKGSKESPRADSGPVIDTRIKYHVIQ